ncbi:MAG TPA: potassium channel family protein [Thermoanaerobaculia bacterium]|nr:potassium channel family protein [Thermoanaerobaculia bacterium]
MRRPAPFTTAWWQEWGLSAMLVLVCLALFVGLPLETLGIVSSSVVGVIMTFLFVSGVVAMAGRGWATMAVAAVVLVFQVVRWLSVIFPSRTMNAWDLSLGLVALVLLTAFVLRHTFRDARITGDRVRGGILAYVLLGLIWCVAYQLVDAFVPTAFQFPRAHEAVGPGRLSHDLAYYSFVTLTTVGYGDITPLHPVARALAMVEALIGQLYPAILIARLVSLQMASKPGGSAP